MSFWIYLLIAEAIPVILFVLGGLYESNSTKYKENKISYKSIHADKDKASFEYCNKVAAKLFGATGTLLFIVNAISLFLFGEGSFTFVLLFSLFMVGLTKMLIDMLIKKKMEA
ncbi:MAG: hypothetical protein E6248_00730 [Clostridium sp.]|uniref:hypothetical protein n=1 Tax=Clostridium sp. TaxID=1506 RepID=UPI00290E843B|nr:hypothetical protein [Clostridium sp.]MDU5108942.1 hypothetical protein [Clostridium sp.]